MLKKSSNMQPSDSDKSVTYRINKVDTFTLLDLIKTSAPHLLTHSFVKTYQPSFSMQLFRYDVEDGYKKWTIIKRFSDFLDLKKNLSLRYHNKMLPIPVQNIEGLTEIMFDRLLSFFEVFLNQLVKDNFILQEKVLKEFLSNWMLHDQKDMKIYFQGKFLKKAWGRHNQSGLKKLFNFLANWEQRYFTITGQGLYFTVDQQSHEILDHLIFSTTFSFLYGEAATGYPFGVIVNSSHRVLQMYAEDIFTLVLFINALNKAISENQNTTANRYLSFARIRQNCQAKYYIDGQDYFSDLCDHLLAAQKQVFITGWMISPFFCLKRPDHKQEFRLDSILQKLAKAGIKINIAIYNGPKVALNIDSQFTQRYLTSLSHNIRVLMHPNYVLIPFMWSHHQKMVVIDQKIGFMGGLDLGYGRMDTKRHSLTDTSAEIWPGIDYCNYRITDILQPKQFRQCSINRQKVPRMPWHDIGVRLQGGAVQDMARHFIQYWNYVNFQLNMDDRQLLMYVGLNEKALNKQSIEDDSEYDEEQTLRQSIILNRQGIRLSSTEQEPPLFNFLPAEDQQIKRRSMSTNYDLVLPDADVPIQRSNSFSQKKKLKQQQIQHQKQMQFYAAHLQDKSKLQNLLNRLNPLNLITNRKSGSFEDVVLVQNSQSLLRSSERKRTQTHQILRSASMWGLGIEQDKTERSIQNAYVQLIQNAKEFIYIQNQFFISVDNKVTDQLCKRLLKAHQFKQRFKVIIILPALPGFQGHPANQNAAVFRVQVHLHLKNIKNMYDKLSDIPNLRQHLYFFSLRTHDKLNGTPVTQIVYVHSKLMIVDDDVVLLGSANINDRSLKGSRDTQLSVVIQDSQKKEIKIKEGIRKVNEFAHELRKQLYMQHFGLKESECIDYLDDDIWDAMIQWSCKNHQIYRQLFGCYPDNQMSTFQDMDNIKNDADCSRYDLLKDIIKGHAIPFQTQFLINQVLSLKPNQKEYFLPDINFT